MATISECYSICSIKGTAYQAGGIVGDLYHTSIENCYATGSIEGGLYPVTSSGVGGIVGNGEGWIDANVIVKNCVALNPFVNGGGRRIGRLYLAAEENLYAWEKMTINSYRVTGGTSVNAHGQSLSSEDILTGDAWPDVFKSGAWDYTEGRLPTLAGLSGQDGAIPAHILEDMSTEGDEDNPYIIATEAQLAQIATDVANGKTFEDKYFLLTADLDLSGYDSWLPIGDAYARVFHGNFDGQGHTISNLTILETANLSYVGLFGRASSGAIQNLHLENVNISGNGMAGGFVGNSLNMDFINCSVSGAVTGRGTAGGIVGYASIVIGVSNSYNSMTNCSSAALVTGVHVAGGLAGTFNGPVVNCFATGDVIRDNTAYTDTVSGCYAGGLIAYHYDSAMMNCYATGNVTSTIKLNSYDSTQIYTGGLVGMKFGDIMQSCYSTGDVSMTVTNPAGGTIYAVYTGGLVGFAAGRGSSNTYITDSLALGSAVTASHGDVTRLVGYASDETYTVSIDEAYVYEGMTVNGAIVDSGTGAQTIQGGDLAVSRIFEAGASSLWAERGFADTDWKIYAGWPPLLISATDDSVLPNQPVQWPDHLLSGYDTGTLPTTADLLYNLSDVTYTGNPQSLNVSAKPGINGLGTIAVLYDGSATAPVNAGTYVVTADIAAGTEYASVRGLSLGSFTINPATPDIADLSYSLTSAEYKGNPRPLSVTAASGIEGLGQITVKYDGFATVPANAGTYAVTVDITAGANYTAATALSLGSYSIGKKTPTAFELSFSLADVRHCGYYGGNRLRSNYEPLSRQL